jgi:hypothetical protein
MEWNGIWNEMEYDNGIWKKLKWFSHIRLSAGY